MKAISSRRHPLVRAFRDLASEPDRCGSRILLDGAHLVHEAQAAGVELEIVAVAHSRRRDDNQEARLADALARRGVEVVETTDEVFAAISPVRAPSGIAAIGRRCPATLEEICSRTGAFVVAAIGVQDPGNVGSLIRAAEAGGATGVLVCAPSANPFSWKALRGSMGSALRLPVVGGIDLDDAFDAMRRAGLRTLAAVARGGTDPDAVDWTGTIGLLVGGEGSGLGDAVVARCDSRVTIPMAPQVESLNVAVAAGVLIYAARRQRTQPIARPS